jgi:hypothetical protein
LARNAGRLGVGDRAAFRLGKAAELREPIMALAWNRAGAALIGTFDGD